MGDHPEESGLLLVNFEESVPAFLEFKCLSLNLALELLLGDQRSIKGFFYAVARGLYAGD